MTSWDYDRLKQKGYGRGSIIRCRMHNFLTYDEVEVFPGPKLNVLLGPNGTGKSAITHAICLACAGKPTLLGRSNQLAQFVKRGKEDDPTGAFVEIDILLNKGEIQNSFVATVRRTLSTESGASKYILNRRNSTEKEIKSLMASLSIDIANLCSFMPQDRVGKFAGYTPQEMLQNTLSSIACSKSLAGGALDGVVEDEQEGDSDVTNLYAVQMRLAEEEKNKISLESERAVKEQEVAKCQHEVDSLAPHVRAMETRQKLVEIRDFYQMKHSILQIQEADKERRKQQELVDAAEEQILGARQLIEPLVSRERDCRRMVAVREKEFAAVDTRYTRAVKVVGDARDKGLECETEIIDMQQQLMHLESEIEKVGGLLAQAKRDEAAHRREFDEANHALQQQNVDAKLQILAEKLGGEYGEREREVADAIFELNNSRDELKERIDTLGRQLSRHTDPVKMWSNEVIKRATNDKSRTLYKSILQQMLYLRDNENQLRAEGKLQGSVYGPICFHCKTSEEECGLMLENAVSSNKWMQFVVTNNHDGDFLKSHFRRQGLIVDVAVIAQSRCDDLPRRLNVAREKLLGRDNLKHLGIKGLLLDCFECPVPIKVFLMDFAGLGDNVYWSSGTKPLTPSRDELAQILPQGEWKVRIFHQTKGARGGRGQIDHVTINRSKYDDRVANSGSSVVASTQLNFLFGADVGSQGEEHVSKQQMEEEINSHKAALGGIDSKLSVHIKKQADVRALIIKAKEEQTTFKEFKKRPQTVRGKIANVEKKIKDLEEKQRRLTSEDERRAKLKRLQEAVLQQLSAVKNTVAASKAVTAVFLERCAFEKAKSEYARLCAQLKDELTEAEEGVRVKERERDVAQRERQRAQAAYDEVTQFVTAAKQRVGERGYQLLVENMILECGNFSAEAEAAAAARAGSSSSSSAAPAAGAPGEQVRLNSLGRPIRRAYTVEAVEIIIHELEVEIDSTIENQDIFARYAQAQDALAKSTAELGVLLRNATASLSGLDERISKWFEAASNVMLKLNVLFSEYMEALSYRGEVELVQTGTIDAYEVSMRVAFRAGEEMSRLTAERHSGGEKSVSTIMYLMALQGLTTSPFRVVDEINQGMDERNERLVIDRIVKSCCDDVEGDGASSSSSAQGHRKNKPQYFLVTPKLLQALRAIDHPDVTVLMVWNGPGVTDNKWQLSDMVKVLRQKCIGQGVATDDVEFSDDEDGAAISSGVGAGSLSRKRPITVI